MLQTCYVYENHHFLTYFSQKSPENPMFLRFFSEKLIFSKNPKNTVYAINYMSMERFTYGDCIFKCYLSSFKCYSKEDNDRKGTFISKRLWFSVCSKRSKKRIGMGNKYYTLLHPPITGLLFSITFLNINYGSFIKWCKVLITSLISRKRRIMPHIYCHRRLFSRLYYWKIGYVLFIN